MGHMSLVMRAALRYNYDMRGERVANEEQMMNKYNRTRRGYTLQVIENAGRFDAVLTDQFGHSSTNPGWGSYEIALQVVQDMFNKATK